MYVPQVQATISSMGGTVEVTGNSPMAGAQVNIPPAALPANWTITIAEPQWVSRSGLPAGVTPVGQEVALGPGGTQFTSPAQLCLMYDPTELASLGLDASTLKIYQMAEPISVVSPSWIEVTTPTTVDLVANRVCASITHFSVFGLGGGAALGAAVGGGVGGILGALAGEEGGGCYVVSSAFGSSHAPEVQMLMQVRRRYLEPHPVGQRLVTFYEAVGPSLARFLDQHAWLKGMVRGMVTPLVQACRLLVEPHGQSPWHPNTTPHVGRHPAPVLDVAARAHGQRPWPDGGVKEPQR
jgi:hypothetical protein